MKSLLMIRSMGRGGGQVVSVLAFYSDDTSLNRAVYPADAYSFSVKYAFEKDEKTKMRPRFGPFFLIKC